MKAVVVILFLLVVLLFVLRSNQKRVSEYRACYRFYEYLGEAKNGNCSGKHNCILDCNKCPYWHGEKRYDK